MGKFKDLAKLIKSGGIKKKLFMSVGLPAIGFLLIPILAFAVIGGIISVIEDAGEAIGDLVSGESTTNTTQGSTTTTTTENMYWWPLQSTEVEITKKYSQDHKGIDIGTEDKEMLILAAKAGTVTEKYTIFENAVYGKYVKITHEDGTIAMYANASTIVVNVGDRVEKGQVIGKTGKTGDTHGYKGNMLYFELIEKDGSHLDPENHVDKANPKPMYSKPSILKQAFEIKNEKIMLNENFVEKITENLKSGGIDIEASGLGTTKDKDGNVVLDSTYLKEFLKAEGATMFPYIGDQGDIIGAIKIKRATTDSDDGIGTDITYVGKTELESLISKGDSKVLKHFSLDGDNLLYPAWTNMDGAVSYTIQQINYLDMISEYIMPYEFLVTIGQFTQSPEYVLELAKLAKNSQIYLTIQDFTTETKTTEIDTCVDETQKSMTLGYREKMEDPNTTSGNVSNSTTSQTTHQTTGTTTQGGNNSTSTTNDNRPIQEKTEVTTSKGERYEDDRKVSTITTNNPQVNVTYAKTWISTDTNEYVLMTQSNADNPYVAEQDTGEEPFGEYGNVTRETNPSDISIFNLKKEDIDIVYLDTKERTRKVEKKTRTEVVTTTKQFTKGPTKRETEDNVKKFLDLLVTFNQEGEPDYKEYTHYPDKGEVRVVKPASNLISASDWLFSTLEQGQRTQPLVRIMKYFMYRLTNDESYGETDLNSILDSIRNETDFESTGTGYWWPIGSDEITKGEDGKEYASAAPKNNMVITSGVGPRWGKVHGGIDIAPIGGGTPPGANIISTADGVVIGTAGGTGPYKDNGSLGNRDGGGFGNYVKVQCGDIIVIYGHLAQGSIRVNPGETVKQGQVIGNMGHSGNSTGMHLHFQMQDLAGTKLDPEEYVDMTNPRPSINKLTLFYRRFEGQPPESNGEYVVFDDGAGNLTIGWGLYINANKDLLMKKNIDPNTLTLGARANKKDIDDIINFIVNSYRESVIYTLKKANIELKDYQIDALADLKCNTGNINGFVEAYNKYGEEQGLYDNYFAKRVTNNKGEVMGGLVKRRKAEWVLFTTGDYGV